MNASNTSGYLEIVVGPMFSGKTSELQRRLRLAQIAGYRVKGFKFLRDARYGEKMNTHDSMEFEAENFENIFQILEKSRGFEVVGIDEVQFALLGDSFSTESEYLEQCWKAINEMKERIQEGTRFIAAGLPTNFRGEPFNMLMNLLLGNADRIDSFTAICTFKNRENQKQCNNTATRTQRIIDGQPAAYNDPLTLIGAKESYEARCPLHHFVPKVKTEQLF